jgi:hypothetical protein
MLIWCRFLQEEEAGQLQENLSQIFGFEGDDKIDANILELIKENPQNYVLKP